MAYQYDTAAATLGCWADSKLEERNKNGTRKYKLAALLADRKAPKSRAKRYRTAGRDLIGKDF